MKKIFLLITAQSIGLIFVTANIACGQAARPAGVLTGTIRTQNTWARPVLKDANFNVLPAGTVLQPNTFYNISIEALPPIARDNQGVECLNVVYIESGDGFAPGALPRGLDVPVPGGRGYRADIGITTDNAANLPPRLYIRYRGVTFEDVDPVTGLSVRTPTINVQQALIP